MICRRLDTTTRILVRRPPQAKCFSCHFCAIALDCLVEDCNQAKSHGAHFDNLIVADFRRAGVPDGGTTLALLGIGVAGLAGLRRKI